MHRRFGQQLIYVAWLIAGLAALATGWYALGGAAPAATSQRYVEGIVGEPMRINPLYASLNGPDADLSALIFNGLTRIGVDGTPEPDLAERWSVTPDGLAYTFELRPNVFWHDGQRLDAGDIAFTIAQLQADEFAGEAALASPWRGVVVTVDGPLTLTARLPAPSASFLSRTAIGVLPEHLLAGLDAEELFAAPFNRAPIGTGPFRLVKLSTRRAVLERNPSYYEGSPKLREIELRFFRTRSALAAAMTAGELDATLIGETPTAAGRAAMRSRSDLSATPLSGGGYTVLYLNNQRDPLNDARLRLAIAASIDPVALATGPSPDGSLPGDGPILPGSWAYAAGEWPTPAEAGELFASAAWLRREDGTRVRGGEPLRLEMVTNSDPAREALAEAVAGQLREQGVEVVVTVMSSVELVTRRLEPRDYELAIFGWETGVDPDPYGAWHTSQIPAPGRNIAGYHDALADALLEAARTTLDIEERRDLYERFTARFVETAASVILRYPARLYVHPTGLEGLVEGVLFEPADRFRNVHRWRVTGSDG